MSDTSTMPKWPKQFVNLGILEPCVIIGEDGRDVRGYQFTKGYALYSAQTPSGGVLPPRATGPTAGRAGAAISPAAPATPIQGGPWFLDHDGDWPLCPHGVRSLCDRCRRCRWPDAPDAPSWFTCKHGLPSNRCGACSQLPVMATSSRSGND